ncbi:sugar tyrosine-protein kinase [Klebsiella aerogenes]
MNYKKILSMMSIILLLAFFGSRLMLGFIQGDKSVRELAIEKVNRVQVNYNKGDLLEIYNEGTDDFKKIMLQDSFILLMERKKEMLGDFVSSELLASNVINANVVMLTYRSKYKKYSLIEEFKFIRTQKNDDLKLGTYFIDDGGKRGEVIRQ